MVGYFWQQPIDLLTILSGSILASLNSVLHSGARLIHFKCRSNSVTPLLKHTRTFPSQNKIWGLYYGLLMPCMFWYPAISLTSFSTLFLLTLLQLCWSCFSSSQVYSFPEACALADTARTAPLTDSLTSFRSLSSHSIPLPYLVFFLNEHLPPPNNIYFCFLSLRH